MNSWMVNTLSKIASPMLRQAPTFGRPGFSKLVQAYTSRHISSSSPALSTVPYSQVNFTKRQNHRIKTWRDGQRPGPGGRNDWDGIMGVTPRIGLDNAPELWLRRHERGRNSILSPHNAYTGRSIAVKSSSDDDGVAEAWSKLTSRLKRNNVYADFKRNERHEKKGVKRRRLESERWRRRFAHEVRKKIELVNAIRRRGA